MLIEINFLWKIVVQASIIFERIAPFVHICERHFENVVVKNMLYGNIAYDRIARIMSVIKINIFVIRCIFKSVTLIEVIDVRIKFIMAFFPL